MPFSSSASFRKSVPVISSSRFRFAKSIPMPLFGALFALLLPFGGTFSEFAQETATPMASRGARRASRVRFQWWVGSVGLMIAGRKRERSTESRRDALAQ